MSNIFRSSNSLIFFAIAVIVLVTVKVFIIDGIDAYQPPAENKVEVKVSDQERKPASFADLVIDNIDLDAAPKKEAPSFDFSLLMPQPDSIENEELLGTTPSVDEAPQEEKFAAIPKPIEIPKPEWDGKTFAKVAIIIDDMGMARQHTREIIDLPKPMTLAFLPYAKDLSEFTVPAKAKGHELIIHVPMEPMNSDLDLGPAGLTTKLDKAEFLRRLEEDIFTSFDGYVGINNHMGSMLTQDERAMNWLMPVLREKGLLFVDSKTIHSSIAADTARKYGVDYAERDVFLDHNEDLQSVLNSLKALEKVARKNGSAIAIGHPKPNTIKALEMWMPTMQERGLVLVPASDLVHRFKQSAKQEASVTLLQDIKPSSGHLSSEDLLQFLQPE